MRFLKYPGGLLAALVAHLIGGHIYPNFSIGFDVFLVALIFYALNGNPLTGMLGGLAAGLLTDGVTGGLYGLYGVVDTIVGYSAAITARRLVIQRPWSIAAMLCIAAAFQQILLLVLQLLLIPLAALPSFSWVVIRILTSGIMGIGVYIAIKQFRRRTDTWRRSRTSKIRFSR
jgi:rod shape-determining protein MreD